MSEPGGGHGQHAHGAGHGHEHGPSHDHAGSHGHSHGHAHAHGAAMGKALVAGIALNLAFVGVEAFFGVLSHSLALLADAAHNLGDVLGLVLAAVAARLSRRAPSQRFTYGLGASSILAALANALLLVFVTGGLMWEAVLRLQNPPPVQGGTTIVVALVGVAVNGLTALFLHGGHQHDLNVKGAYLHMVADALVSLGVAVAGGIVLATGWSWMDPAVTLLVGAFIVYSSVGLLRDSLKLALQGVPGHIDSEAVRGYLLEQPGVRDVHDLHIWALGTTQSALTAHLVCPGGHPGDAVLDRVTHDVAERFGIGHSTLQVETRDCGLGCDDADAQAGVGAGSSPA